jgi:hypothetical protein
MWAFTSKPTGQTPDAVQGVVVTVTDGNKEAVFVNVVGNIQVDKLATIGERFGIDPLKHIPPPVQPAAEEE